MASSEPGAPRTVTASADWWRDGVGYEIYIRSFQDSNADGTGDLAGITARLDHLAHLGVDVVWITPFYPSPGKDHGYDVSDYCDVDPAFGTLADFDTLVAAAHERGLRLFVDIVPNHSSDQHAWFRAALADPSSPYRDYYIFRPPAVDGGPPNNWVSHFGGSAWSPDPAGTGDYYLHLFLPEQPDLNWANPAVTDEFLAILRFWCERGVDGFRIDVAHGLAKQTDLADNRQLRPVTPDMHPTEVFLSYEHVNDLHRAETIDIYRRWHAEVAPYGAVLFGEMETPDAAGFGRYVAHHDALDGAFILTISSMPWEPPRIIETLLQFQHTGAGGAVWALSNHDQPRAVSRFGAADVGHRRAVDRVLAVMTVLVALDGIPFLYQGEELGLPNAEVIGASEDPLTTRNDGAVGRDVARGGMPWDGSHRNGFTTAPTAWLETAELPAELTAAGQVDDAQSTYATYRELVSLRHRLPQLHRALLEILHHDDEVVVLRRDDLIVVANLGAEPRDLSLDTLDTLGDVVFESGHGAVAHAADRGASVIRLGAERAAVVRRGRHGTGVA